MKLASYENGRFVLRGECPHCNHLAAFRTVATYSERSSIKELMPGFDLDMPDGRPVRLIGIARCEACNEYILGVLKVVDVEVSDYGDHRETYKDAYEAHYPLGRPSDFVHDAIPADIRKACQEALRCRWIEAYNATVEMCRALEASCEQQKAKGSQLLEKIDHLFKEGIITKPLKEMAHQIRLGGNRGAHGPADMTDDDADSVMAFTRHYFEHVYIMPKALERANFSKSASPSKT